MNPKDLEVTITYRVPEPVVKKLVAGACYEAIQDLVSERFLSKWELPHNGRQLRRSAVLAVGERSRLAHKRVCRRLVRRLADASVAVRSLVVGQGRLT